MFYLIVPEVPEQLGDSTELDTKSPPPIVHKLEIYLEDWLGDDLL